MRFGRSMHEERAHALMLEKAARARSYSYNLGNRGRILVKQSIKAAQAKRRRSTASACRVREHFFVHVRAFLLAELAELCGTRQWVCRDDGQCDHSVGSVEIRERPSCF